ncbi:MAG TPA: zinc ABC transporter substrate-binding protein [bacterium]|nr:zinc ABC transporter substrate-binding protein [bacterium]
MTRLISRRALLRGTAGLAPFVLLSRGIPAAAAPARIPVVAAENFYGNVVGQIAGDHVLLTSIITDPNADPHEYESSTRNMAAIARARLVIINGMGYDGFMPKLLRATPNPAREVMDVSQLAGKKAGDNWHIWYDPTVMPKFARAVTDFFVRIDAANARSYQNRLRLFEASYKPFTSKVAAMRARFAGTPVGATEPIFENMAAPLVFKILTSKEFEKAVEEGEDPPARAVAEMEDQLRKHAIKVLIYNVQTVSPVTERIRKDAGRLGIPIVGVCETLPPGLSYQRWMLKQLDELEQALSKTP